MKPNFALSLSFEGIGLLRRGDRGWLSVGDVALDAPDLQNQLKLLRRTAQELDGRGLQTKLIIPNDQIKYLAIVDDGSDEDLTDLVRAALDGATPYPVDDLAFDWRRRDGEVQIAAVAKETLAEAEAFAVEHKFSPVSFVAVPEPERFVGEPFFGPTGYAKSLPGQGQDIVPDAQAILVTGQFTPPPQEVVEEEEPDDLEDAPEQESIQTHLTDIEEASDAAQSAAQPEPESAAPPVEAPAIAPAPSFSSIRAQRGSADVATSDTAPRVSAEARFHPVMEDLPAPKPLEHAEPVAPRRLNAGGMIKGLRGSRKTKSAAPEAPDESPATSQSEAKPRLRRIGFGRSKKASDEQAEPVAVERTETTPKPRRVGFGFGKKDNGEAAPATETAAVVVSTQVTEAPSKEQGFMGLGANRDRRRDAAKSFLIGLGLTIVLIIGLILIALFAISSEEGLSGFFKRTPAPEIVVVRPGEENLVPDGVVTAALDPADIDPALASQNTDIVDSAEIEALSEPALPPELSPQEAEAQYAVTGIWQMAPEKPTYPPAQSLDRLYIASIDNVVEPHDAVALPDITIVGPDVAVLRQISPVSPDTVFAYDDRGFVLATPEGALTPDGVVVFAGRPAVLPASLPDRAENGVIAAVDAALLATVRPRLRPGNLVERSERSEFAGRTLAELADIRPRLRPASAKAEAESDETPTAQAVVQSVKPKPRPSGFDSLVAKARAAQPEESAATVTAAVATVTPNIPTTASVARQATLENAINLRKINLIGVYGTPSDRRALVRLASGRYKKVKAGDRIDGGKVTAISEGELRYTKGGRSITLKLPKG